MRGLTLLLPLLLHLAACGEPIEQPAPRPGATERTLPVITSPRVYEVGQAFRVSIVITRSATQPSSRIEYVDVVASVVDGRIGWVDRHVKGETEPLRVVVATGPQAAKAQCDFSVFEELLPRRGGDVPEAWHLEGVLGALSHSSALHEVPPQGGTADCRLESVQIRSGRARAIIRVEYQVDTPKGMLKMSGRIEHDLKEKLLVLADLNGTLGADAVTIRATRSPTRFVPSANSAARED